MTKEAALYSLQERETALAAAVDVLAEALETPSPETVLAYASAFLAFISGARLRLSVDPLTYEQGTALHQPTRYVGDTVQLTDTQQVTLTVEPEDSKGDPTSDTLTWSSSDTTGTILTLTPSADTLSCLVVAGVPGLGTVVTATDGTLSATESIDVLAGAVTSLVITAGTPEEQPPAAPPAP